MHDSPKELEYLKILVAIDNLRLNVGKKLLIDFLAGDDENESIRRNKINKEALFGYFALSTKEEIESIVDNLFFNDLLEYKSLPDNKFIKVIALTEKGKNEVINPSLYKRKLSNNFSVNETIITEDDHQLFSAFDFFLKGYNDEQKKAIVCPKSNILCIAGAGSGKTTVLTKRIEFLTTFRSIIPERILAITFTRKARTEMMSRISKSQYCNGVIVETFNSFCEKIIKQNNDLIYDRNTRMISYPEKIRLFKMALSENNININSAIDSYFSYSQRRLKTHDDLAKMLMNDCYSVLELQKMNYTNLDELKKSVGTAAIEEQKNLEILYTIVKFIDSFMKKFGLRDYADQIIHCIRLFKEHSECTPRFEHVLVDEYQDVNSLQIELINLLKPQNIFCVGDPRQSIFGWRGSKIKYILNFEESYPDCEIITLSTNYRSSKQIVELINKSLENLRLPDLRHSLNADSGIHLLNFDSEDDEFRFVVSKIIELEIPRNEIFVLARTNRIIAEISNLMKLKGVKHLIRTEEFNREDDAARGEVTLATIHSIKGLEANSVFLVGCTGLNFPCKASDHPVIEMIKLYEYDKEEEERRLFYVALSRAKHELYLTYSGKSHTRFINDKMLGIIKSKPKPAQIKLSHSIQVSAMPDAEALARLKLWRREISQKLNLPAYIIMHDKTLIDIVTQNPNTIEELGRIKGIGSAKLERYGNDIIGIINNLK